jgi:hypothetical protein
MGNCSPGNIDSEDEEEKQFESYITSIKNLIEDDKLDMVNQETTTLPAQIESVILIQTHFRKQIFLQRKAQAIPHSQKNILGNLHKVRIPQLIFMIVVIICEPNNFVILEPLVCHRHKHISLL